MKAEMQTDRTSTEKNPRCSADQICARIAGFTEQGMPLGDILAQAVQLVHDTNPRFHWTGIYELYPDNILRLGPFIGAPTNHVFICVGQGVCGSAVGLKKNINVPDVSKAANYLACSQETRSELVVLIRKGARIYAQIDIDSHEYAAFDREAEELVCRVADCLANAYERQQLTRMEPDGAPGQSPS